MNKLKDHILIDKTLFELYINFKNYRTDNDVIIFESKFSANYKTPIKYVDDKVLKGFEKLKQQQLDILYQRFLYKKTLQEVANSYGITRERVRQIEQKSIRVFFATIEASFVMKIIQNVQQDLFISTEHLNIKDTELREVFCRILSHRNSRSKLIFDADMQILASSIDYSLSGILASLEKYLSKIDKTTFSKEELYCLFESIFPKITDYEKIMSVLKDTNNIKKINNNARYYFPFIYTQKRSMVEFVFSLYPNALSLHKNIHFIADSLDMYFPNVFKNSDRERAIQGLAGYSEKIFLWGWGSYIHISYVKLIIDKYDFSRILNYLDEYLQDTQIDLQSCYEMFEDDLLKSGIDNKYALHTCLKLKYPTRYSYQDSPWISQAGTERRRLGQTLKNIMTENRIYTLEELIEQMHTIKTRVQQLIDNTNGIIQVNAFEYKRKEFIDFSDELLVSIIQFINGKVEVLGFIYIDLVLNNFIQELSQYQQYDISLLLLELLKKDTRDKFFNVSNTRLVHRSIQVTRTSLNFHILIENLLKEKSSISINELVTYFSERGLAQDRILNYYHYSKIKKIVRLDKETFVGINSLGLTENDINNINNLLENNLKFESHIDDILSLYQLPAIKQKWNRFILTDIMDYNRFVFEPSRENPHYISPKSL